MHKICEESNDSTASFGAVFNFDVFGDVVQIGGPFAESSSAKSKSSSKSSSVSGRNQRIRSCGAGWEGNPPGSVIQARGEGGLFRGGPDGRLGGMAAPDPPNVAVGVVEEGLVRVVGPIVQAKVGAVLGGGGEAECQSEDGADFDKLGHVEVEICESVVATEDVRRGM